MNVLDPGGSTNVNPVQTAATAASTHQMLVAAGILLAGGMLLVLIAGASDDAGNAVIGLLAILLFLQALTKVNPFIEWINKHPLTPQVS